MIDMGTPKIDMGIPWSQLRSIPPHELSGLEARFYVRRGWRGNQTAGILYNETSPKIPAKGNNALYRIKVRFK